MKVDPLANLHTRIQSLPPAQRPPQTIALEQILGTCSIHLPTRRHRPYRLHALQWLPCEIDEVFDFFGDALNLETLTPAQLRFEVLSEPPIEMRPGQLIDYGFKVRGIPIRWQSEVTCWEPPYRFIDVQTRGPYRLWHHEHRLEPHPAGGTLAIDMVQFLAPGPAFLHRWFVIPDLQRIFEYRQGKLLEQFAPALAAAIDDRWPEDGRSPAREPSASDVARHRAPA